MSENEKQMGENLKRYGKLRGKMREKGINGNYLARKLDTTPQSVSHRMTGKTPWRMDEMYYILSMLGEPDSKLPEYFPRNGIDLPEEYDNNIEEKQELLDRIAKLISIM